MWYITCGTYLKPNPITTVDIIPALIPRCNYIFKQLIKPNSTSLASYNNNNSQQVPSMVTNQHFLETSVGVSHNKEVVHSTDQIRGEWKDSISVVWQDKVRAEKADSEWRSCHMAFCAYRIARKFDGELRFGGLGWKQDVHHCVLSSCGLSNCFQCLCTTLAKLQLLTFAWVHMITDHHMIITDHHMIITWSSHDRHMIVTWSSHDITWSSHDITLSTKHCSSFGQYCKEIVKIHPISCIHQTH